MEKIYQLSYELKELLSTDERMISLNEAEEKMNNSEEVMKLSYKKDIANDEYCDALRYFGQDSNEAKVAQKNLYIAKKELEEHPLVKDYLSKYQVIRILLEEINDNIFSIINMNMCGAK